MDTVPITLLFSDGAARRVEARPGDSVVAAAAEAGLHLLTDCANGQCGTCTCQLVSGAVALDAYDRAVLPDADRAQGAILGCVARVTGPCVVEMPYELSEAMAEEAPPVAGTVVSVERVAQETVRLAVELAQPVRFEPGQYVRIRAAGSDAWRSYSMANASGERTLVFYVRLVDGGAFSSWLANDARPGAAVVLSEPRGSFFLRSEPRPRLFVAGGTGLAPFLSMLDAIAADESLRAQPTTLLVGVRSGGHLFALEQLEKYRALMPSLDVRLAAETEAADGCHGGYATDLIGSLGLDPSTRIYLCGPPPMVEAGRSAAEGAGLPRADMLCERFN